MAIDTDKFIVPDGAPSLGVQKMKSVTFGEASLLMGNDVLTYPNADGDNGDVITSDGAGNLAILPIPRVSTTPYTFKSSTAPPPGTGNLSRNNADPSLTTELYLDDINANGTDISAFIEATFPVGAVMRLQRQNDESQFQDFTIEANVDSGAYHTLTVTFGAQGGSDFSNNNTLLVLAISGVAQTQTQVNAVSSSTVLPVELINSQLYLVDSSGGDVTLTLPLASTMTGKSLFFKKTDASANSMIVLANVADLIDGEVSVESDAQYDGLLMIASGGTSWHTVADYARTVGFSADRDGELQQSIPSGVATIVQNSVVKFDIGNFYNNSTYTWQPKPGIYAIKCHVRIFNLDSNDEVDVVITKNGSPLYFNNKFGTANNQNPAVGAEGVTIADGTDTYQMTVEHNQGGPLNISSNSIETYFYGLRIK